MPSGLAGVPPGPRAGLDVIEKTATMPFADHFPFSAFGIPSVTLMRPNMDGGMRWQHPTAPRTISKRLATELAKVIQAVSAVAELARSPRWPFSRGLARQQRPETARMAHELFGLRT